MSWAEKSETAKRIAAARILKGWDQTKLNDLLKDAEVGSDMATRLENDAAALPKPRRNAVSEVLGVGDAWFTAPLGALLRERPPPSQLDRIETKLDEVLRRLDGSDPAMPLGGTGPVKPIDDDERERTRPGRSNLEAEEDDA